jgi:hypothetical protein
MRPAIIFDNYFCEFLKQKLTQAYYQCLESIIIAHFICLFFLTLALKTRDICHGTIGSGMIKIESQPN